jgi:hypothetical protein
VTVRSSPQKTCFSEGTTSRAKLFRAICWSRVLNLGCPKFLQISRNQKSSTVQSVPVCCYVCAGLQRTRSAFKSVKSKMGGGGGAVTPKSFGSAVRPPCTSLNITKFQGTFEIPDMKSHSRFFFAKNVTRGRTSRQNFQNPKTVPLSFFSGSGFQSSAKNGWSYDTASLCQLLNRHRGCEHHAAPGPLSPHRRTISCHIITPPHDVGWRFEFHRLRLAAPSRRAGVGGVRSGGGWHWSGPALALFIFTCTCNTECLILPSPFKRA